MAHRETGSISKGCLIVAGAGCGLMVLLVISCIALGAWGKQQTERAMAQDRAVAAEAAKAEAAKTPEQRKAEADKLAAIEKAAKDNLQKNGVALRKAFAEAQENKYLDEGMNADVTTQGQYAETLRIKWALVSKVAAHDMGKGDLLDAAKKLGFKKVILTNGFESSLGESYSWDLTKDD